MRRGKTARHIQSVQQDSRQEKDGNYQTHDKTQLSGIATGKRAYEAVGKTRMKPRPDASRKKNLNPAAVELYRRDQDANRPSYKFDANRAA
jgi:hypothetical protein